MFNSLNEPLSPGDTLGRYTILSRIGRGGMALVYKAHQPDLDRMTALKVLWGSSLQLKFMQRFQTEAKAVAKISHPGVVPIYEVGEENGLHYMAMEYVAGPDLEDYLKQIKPSLNEVIDIVRDIAEALAFCHQRGIIHRDLKPGNILMREGRPVLIDFGLAKGTEEGFSPQLTLSGEVVGSPAYMSPEQAQGGDISHLSDICSLGIILYELVSFKNPYLDPRSLHQTALNAIRAEPVALRHLVPWIDRQFEAIVDMAIAPESKNRYQNMDELIADLDAYQQGTPLKARPPGTFQKTWSFVRQNPVLYWPVLVVVLVTVAVSGYLSIQEENRTPRWGPVIEEFFNDSSRVMALQSFSYQNGKFVSDTNWMVDNGRLVGGGEGIHYVMSQQDFFGDLKLEFDIQLLSGVMGEFQVFLYGSSPTDGIRFFYGKGIESEAGIQWGPEPSGFYTKPVKGFSSHVHKMVVEKDGYWFRLWMDGRLIIERSYTLPMLVEQGSRIGFATRGGPISIDNLRILKRGIALSATPTVVADAYLAEGFLQNGIQAYKHIIETYPAKPVSDEAKMKLGKCYLSLEDYGLASEYLVAAASHSKDAGVVPEALYHLAVSYFQQGRVEDGYKKLQLIPQVYPESEMNVILAESLVEGVYNCLENSVSTNSCAGMFIKSMDFLLEYEAKLIQTFGPWHVDLLSRFRKKGAFNPLEHSRKFNEPFSAFSSLTISLNMEQSRYLLGKGQYQGAFKKLQEISTLPLVSNHDKAEINFLFGHAYLMSGDFNQALNSYQSSYQFGKTNPGLALKSYVFARLTSLLINGTHLTLPDRIEQLDQMTYQQQLLVRDLHRLRIKPMGSLSSGQSNAPANLLEVVHQALILAAKEGSSGPVREYLREQKNRLPLGTMENLFISRVEEKIGLVEIEEFVSR